MRNVIIHCDGSCWPNPGPGSWAAVIQSNGDRTELSGRGPDVTTNNRMELTAAIEALGSLAEQSVVDLYTDSEYLRNGGAIWMHRWQKKLWRGTKNSDLWRLIWGLCQYHRVRWHWVRGHADCEENNRCDYLAEIARKG